MTALDLDDRELLVTGLGSGLQLEGPLDRLLGLIEAVESREINGEPVVPGSSQRLGGERLPREIDRTFHRTESGELGPEIELCVAVIRRELQRDRRTLMRSSAGTIHW